MSSGYMEIHRGIEFSAFPLRNAVAAVTRSAKPSKQMRPPVSPGEHLSRNIMSTSHHSGALAPDGQELVQTHQFPQLQMVNVYEVNYSQRSSSVPRGVRHLESHVEIPISPKRKISLEQHRAEPSATPKTLSDRLPRSLYKTRSEGGARYLPHAPKFITSLPSEIMVNPNEKLVITVDVTAIPTADFKWDVNGFEVKPSKNITVLNEQNRSTLVVQPPVKQGKYHVVAFNEEGRESLLTRVVHEVTSTFEQVQTEISIDTKPRPELLLESSVTVTSPRIAADSEMVNSMESTVSTTSFKTVHRREPPTREEVPPTKTLKTDDGIAREKLIKRPIDDETTMTTSYVKSTSTTKTLENIPKRPTLVSAPIQSIHLKAGEVLVLESRVDSSPPATFRWYVNNFEAKNGQFVSITQPCDNVSVATFSKPSAGHYKVVAENPMGDVTSVTRVTTEIVTEEFEERTTVTTSVKPSIFTLTKKPTIMVREDLPKAPRIIEKLPTHLKVGQNEPVTLKVTADAIPEATFMWRHNNFEVKKNQNITINKVESNICELHMQKAQPGRYEVIARNHMGQDSCSCKIIVHYDQEVPPPPPKPTFTKSLLEETTIHLDERSNIEVIISGTPPFSFKWLVNGQELSPGKDCEIIVEGNRSSLVLLKPIGSGSVVTVEVRDRYGFTQSETKVKEVSKIVEVSRVEERQEESKPLGDAPVFVQKLENIEIVEGETLRARVKVTEESGACTFQWFANEMQITSGDQVMIECSPVESRLTIEDMGEMANVQLAAVAHNQYGSSASSAILTVTRRPDESFEMVPPDVPEESAPKIIEPLHSASFIDGKENFEISKKTLYYRVPSSGPQSEFLDIFKSQPMLLRCRIEAVPSAVIVWSKDDINVDEWVINKDVITQILPGGICELMNPEVYPEDSGLYKCTASNPHGTAETAAYINIEGPDYRKVEEGSTSESAGQPEELIWPPKFAEPLTAETDGAYDLNYVRLICRVKSAAPTTISWLRNGVELLPSEKYEFHEFSDGALILTIYSPCDEDNGIYTCKAESAHGLSSTSCQVVVPTRTTTTDTEKLCESTITTISNEPASTTTPSDKMEDQSGAEVTETTITTINLEQAPEFVADTDKEDTVAVTEITKHEEQYKLLVKVADSVASALVANVFVDAVREAVKRIMEEESEEEEEVEPANAPRFETSIERYVVRENDTVTISTKVSGDPLPFIEWYFKEEKLSLTEHISMGYENRVATLILKNVTLGQEGTYYCHATNTHGTTVLASEVKVLPEKANDKVRFSLARYDKREFSEYVVMNVFAYHEDEHDMKSIELKDTEKEDISTHCTAAPAAKPVQEIISEKRQETVEITPTAAPPESAEQVLPNVQKSVETTSSTQATPAEEEPIPAQPAEEEQAPVPKPRKRATKETTAIVETTSLEIEEEDVRKQREEKEAQERSARLIAVKFAESFTEKVMSQEIVNEEDATVDVRKPDVLFEHVVTVVEPEVVQLGLHLPAVSVPSMKFIDLETILQRPGTSSSANTLITSPNRGSANAEHRIVVRKLATESAEPTAFVQVEIIKPSEAKEEKLTIVNHEKIIPDLMRVAAAASKMKLENVTVSLVRQGATSHQELVIEYESCVEDSAEFNLSQLVYSPPKEDSSSQEVWSRRSRYSKVDENVVAVFMEVDANCPDQCVEVVASVSIPLQEKVEGQRSPSPELMEVSESITESSSAIGQQVPRFFRTLNNCEAVIGRSAQFKCIHRFIEHAPSMTELIESDVAADDPENSFDSFEFEESKANRLFPSDTPSLQRSVTYNSEFDLSRIVNYNEDMVETNAFHKYFDTAEATVKVAEWERRERVFATFIERLSETAYVNIIIPKPAAASSAVHIIAERGFLGTHSKIFGSCTEIRRTKTEQAEKDSENVEKKLDEVVSTPREVDLPEKLSYKGREIGVSVSEIEKEETLVNKDGDVEIVKKKCMETSLEFDAELDIKQSIRKISNALPRDEPTSLPETPKTKPDIEQLYKEIFEPVVKEYEIGDISKSVSESHRFHSSPTAAPRPLARAKKSASEGADKMQSSVFDPDFISKMKEIERIARQVDEELGQLSSPVPPQDENVKEIEEAIFKISDQLVLAHPITEAQAEASEELLRTTLADMILNPARTAEEELELMKRPIRLLRRKLSDLENSLMEDAEVTEIIDHPCETTEVNGVGSESGPSLRIQHGPKTRRVPSAEYLRVTPLTSNIKDQLSCLEQMITEHMNSESPDSATEGNEEATSRSKKVESPKKRELHDLFVQINAEINTIKTYCKSRISKRGTDAVMNVLQKVRTHVTSIVNVMSLSKKKQLKSKLEPTINYEFTRLPANEKMEVLLIVNLPPPDDSVNRKSSTTLSTSDDTWRYSTELKSLEKPELPKEVPIAETIEQETTVRVTEVEAPQPPPRRRRTTSAEPDLNTEPPTRPPRRKRSDIKARDSSLDSKRTHLETEKKYATIGPSTVPFKDKDPVPPGSPGKAKRSFAGDTLDLIRNLSCMRVQKGQQDDLEKSLLEELSQMTVSRHEEDDVLSEPEWVQSEVNESLKIGMERAKLGEGSNKLDVSSYSNEKSASAPEEGKPKPKSSGESDLESGSRNDGGSAGEPNPQVTAEPGTSSEYIDGEIVVQEEESHEKPKEIQKEKERLQEEESKPEDAYEDETEKQKKEEDKQPSPQSEECAHSSFEATSLSAAYLMLAEASATLDVPITNWATLTENMFTEDGICSVQLTCEESDYGTDTDTSAYLRGTVQFFNRNSPRDATPQSLSSMGMSQRSSKILPDVSEEQDELPTIEVVADVDLQKCEKPVEDEENAEKADAGDAASVRLSVTSSYSPEKASEISDETVHIVLEETLLSQMASSEVTDDTDRMTPLSRIGVRETDILSDDSIVTEIDQFIVDEVLESFSFVRADAKKGVIAIVFLELRQCVTARIAENTFDVEIYQEPENLALVIRVVEDQVNSTSLTIAEYERTDTDQESHENFDDTSSFDDVGGEPRTGITVSIIARSLHDGIYASLEEIPWGEVEMTLPECENMTKSVEEDSKMSLQFNVTVSESNPDERKSLRSQASLNQSQNTISEADNTLSTGSINIPSYVIKLGSTATITCELNNYLPANSRIDWYKGMSQIDTYPGKVDRISHDLLEVLIIHNVQMDDNELYSLKVNDDIFPVAYLIVEQASSDDNLAVILSPPQTQFVMEGQPTVLMCQVSNPSQEVVWLKDRKPLQESARLQLETGDDGWNRVVFSQTRMSDQGTYFACLGQQSVAITLVVEERIDEKEVTVVASGTESEDDDVQEYLMPPGSTATIACELEDGDRVHNVVWLKNGQEIKFTDPNKMEHVVNGLKHYLVIHDSSYKDNGLYSVSISNVEFRVAHLTVNDVVTASQNLRRKRISNSSLH
ncbi:unnamed protein product [Nippostrongylus brasiliensis]|uniref:Titin n=1 Tax=Nippostrongylus brasiliensis TaxID=27835 RepID=A0A0N4YF82_NIPBR|nr:unnamed protein product [Nippostrongylus brasiliensis]